MRQIVSTFEVLRRHCRFADAPIGMEQKPYATRQLVRAISTMGCEGFGEYIVAQHIGGRQFQCFSVRARLQSERAERVASAKAEAWGL